ncbi:hypothetical protein H4R18_005102 [Coemansia javaensis]|uniref:Uncharacterized protein n=1 Tax=Coemansia javaensis TaxID=2761396 RepID=A0A9W8H623_9FUNG|nr:hypothetical protein H4R18_005102 [Coemansia javaensis]
MATPWWLSSDGEHAHTACPLRPFAHMVVALGDAAGADSAAGGAWAIDPPVGAQQLAAARVVRLSEALRRKLPGAAGAAVGDVLALAARPGAARGAGLWHMLGWLVGAQSGGGGGGGGGGGAAAAAAGTAAAAAAQAAAQAAGGQAPCRRRRHARTPADDPLLVGNEGLGAVELATARGAKQAGAVFALCAHELAPAVRDEWRGWHARAGPAAAAAAAAQAAAGQRLAVVHVAEVSTLHRVACRGVDALVPPPLPLALHFGPLLDAARALGPPPALPPPPRLSRAGAAADAADAPLRWLALLVSRHGLVEMAFPLARTPLAPLPDDDAALDPGPAVALASALGEPLFARVHPEDVARVVKALRLAWDARPDVYHFARLRREWQQRRAAAGAAPRAAASAPSTPPALRPLRAATLAAPASSASSASASASAALGLARQVHHQHGIEVANGVVELTVQIQLTGPAAPLDWADPDATAEHTRFARMKLTRWPLILRPPRPAAAPPPPPQQQQPDDPHDGFVLAALRPLPEPARSRRRPLHAAAPAALPPAAAKRSVSSVASASTSSATLASPSVSAALADSAELVRLCRSTSSLSCQETTARPSIELAAEPSPMPAPIPLARPIVGLSNNAVHTATAMSPHLSARRRSNIPVGSLPAEGGLASRAFATPPPFAFQAANT